MKMYMPLNAPEDGVISLHKQEGSVVECNDLLATLELADPSKVSRLLSERKIEKYKQRHHH